MSGLLKKFGQAKQMLGEKYGSTGKTEASEDFKRMEHQAEMKFAGLDKLHTACNEYLKSLGKKKESGDDKSKALPIEALGTCMMKHGSLLTEDSAFGQALIKFGDAHERIATLQLEYVTKARESYMVALERSMTDMKEYHQLRKKLESRRLDFDAKLNKVQKSKKEKPELEEEMRSAQTKYSESVSDMEHTMLKLIESEDDHTKELIVMLDAELYYFAKSTEILQNLSTIIADRSVRAIARPNLTRSSSAYSETRRFSSFPDNSDYRSAIEVTSEPELIDQPLSSAQSAIEGLQTNIFHSSSSTQSTVIESGGIPISGNSSFSVPVVANLPASLPKRNSKLQVTPPQISTGSTKMVRSNFDFEVTPPQISTGSTKMVRSNFDFEGEDDNELSMVKGDIITVLEKIDEGWWIGEIIDASAPGGKRKGMFPCNYTEEILIGINQQSVPPLIIPRVTDATVALEPSSPFDDIKSDFTDIRSAPQIRPLSTATAYSTSANVTPALARNHSFSNGKSRPPIRPRSATNSSAASPLSHGVSPASPTELKMRAPQQLTADITNNSIQPLRRNTRSLSYLGNIPIEPSAAEVASVPPCKECGCIEYTANVFKKDSCNNCFHRHA